MNPGTPEIVARALSSALEPLSEALSAAQAEGLFAALGLRFPQTALTQPVIAGPLNAARSAAALLSTRRAALDVAIGGSNDTAAVQAGANLLQAITSLFAALDALGAAFAALPPATVPGIDAAALADFSNSLRRRLVAHALVVYMRPRVPTFAGVLALGGVLENVPSRGDAANPAKPAYVRRDIHLERLPDLLTNPVGLLRTLYGWGNPAFNAQALLNALAGFLENLGQMARVDSPAPGQFMLQSLFVDVVPDTTSTPNGLSGRLHASVGDGVERTFPLSPRWTTSVRTHGEFTPETALTITPPATLVLAPPAPNFAGGITASLDWSGPQFIIFGTADQSRLEVGHCSISAGVTFTSRGATSGGQLWLEAKLENGNAVIDTSKGDAFVRFLTRGAHAEGTFWLSCGWTPTEGLRFAAGSGLEIAIPVHACIGPTEFKMLYLRFGVAGGTFAIEMSTALSTSLGPLTASVDRVGVIARVSFPSSGGNLGPANLTFDFKPPTGVALSVDAGGFKGGGFLDIDVPKGEYAGGLELDFMGIVTLKAFGLLSTKFPDGSSGFSLVIIISAEFPPIQLGLGFTLLGVGGLLGLNRTVDEDALREGVHQGTLDSVLFPVDLAANAPRIVNDLRRIFPPLEDHFLVGPMAKFGWGTPTILSLEFGIILDIPRPAFLLIGRLRAGLPFQDLPLFDIRVAFAGGVDFELGQLWFDATLYDSRLLTFTLTGDMAVRLYWKENANFILTVGGFHPAYVPPPMALGTLQRLGITIFAGNPRLRAETYFAVTSNTVQWGAKAELYFGVDAFNVYGFIAYDVLIQFDPFRFIATLSAMLAVRSGSEVLLGIRIDALVEGPTPWHAKGTGHFEISFIISVSIDVDFEVTFGDSRHDTLPQVDVLPKLVEAFTQPANWRAVLPVGTNLQVTLRGFEPPVDSIVLHPFGSLEIREKVVPLNMPIQLMGTQHIGDGHVFGVDRVTVGAAPGQLAPVREQFAPAQFIEMSDAEKLSSRSFEKYEAGVQVGGGDAANADYVKSLGLEYEVIYIPERRKPVFFRLTDRLFKSFAGAGAVSQSALSSANNAPSVLGAQKVNVGQEQFAVASTADLTLHGQNLVFPSEAEARAAMKNLIGRDPSLNDAVQVIPLFLVKEAA